MIEKPRKKSTTELFKAIEFAINGILYYFSDHGEFRSKTRKNVTDEEVLKILIGSDKKHEKVKDKYVSGMADWNYHIRGKTLIKNKFVSLFLLMSLEWSLSLL